MEKKMKMKMSIENQLESWVAGEPVHNHDRDECCPDLSCCNGGHMAPLNERVRFAQAHREGNELVKMEMLLNFLRRTLNRMNLEKKLYHRQPNYSKKIHGYLFLK